MKRHKTGSRCRTDGSVTGELFQWSYRHLNENANNLIKGLERAERERAIETLNDSGAVEKELGGAS